VHTPDSDSSEKVEYHERTIYIKDMRIFAQERVFQPGKLCQYPLSDIVIVDNSLMSFSLQPENGIPISSYFNDHAD
jgi:TFIIF-interacting CTD phosphatase-like protein